MPEPLLLSTAYFPPVAYFNLIAGFGSCCIEGEENYLKQSYRNRCYIMTGNGCQVLSVPVLEGSRHKINIRDVKIDYSKRWKQVHLGAFSAAYRSAPYFEFYFDEFEKIINSDHHFLFDLNMEIILTLCKMTGIEADLSVSTHFLPVSETENDFRYLLSPKKTTNFHPWPYYHVFENESSPDPVISIADLVFNMGPDAGAILLKSHWDNRTNKNN